MEDKAQIVEAIKELCKAGMEFEGLVLWKIGPQIRENSKLAYESARLDARMLLLGVAWKLFMIRNGISGNTSPEIEERLALIAAFYQGVSLIESLISEGQYIKTSAAIKQDYEIVARLNEIRKNPHRAYGKTPNVGYAPENSRHIYGELNDLAHITKHNLLKDILNKHTLEDAHGFSPLPIFSKKNRDGNLLREPFHSC